jgi:hypothetical protein
VGQPGSFKIPLRVVFYQEAGATIAHCLEFDLIGHGASKDEALHMLADAIDCQVGESLDAQNPANLFSPAEGKYFAMFAAGRHVAKGLIEIREIENAAGMIEDVEMREYSATDADLAIA